MSLRKLDMSREMPRESRLFADEIVAGRAAVRRIRSPGR